MEKLTEEQYDEIFKFLFLNENTPKDIICEVFKRNFSPKAEKPESPSTYAEIERMALKHYQYEVCSNGYITSFQNDLYSQHIFPTEKLAKSARAFEQILKIIWVYNDGEKLKEEQDRYFPVFGENQGKGWWFHLLQNNGAAFKTEELSKLALVHFEQLFKDFYTID